MSMNDLVRKNNLTKKIKALEYELNQHLSIDDYPLPKDKSKIDIRYYELIGEIKGLKDVLEDVYEAGCF